jgi:putative oxidoreductase
MRPALGWVQGALALLARAHVAWAFWASGLTKLRDWDTTLALFENEYAVPLLNPTVAAWLGTGGELLLPALLMLGLGGRLAAAGLFVLNAVAVLSLPDVAPAAWAQHQLWGALLLMLWFWGPGALSVDAWRARWLSRSAGSR